MKNKKVSWQMASALIGALLLLVVTRLFWLSSSPPSLYWEEVALGYDAFSIAETGKDHHGNPWPLVAFESFGDWKPSLYIYALVPIVKLFGLTEWVVRLPAAISGIAIALATAGITFLITQQLFDRRTSAWISIGALYLIAINPWAIQFSRAAWEINLATALISWGIATWLYATLPRKKHHNQIHQIGFGLMSGFLFGLSLYAQHSARVVVPLLSVWLFVWSILPTKFNGSSSSAVLKNIRSLLPFVMTVGITLICFVSPILMSFSSPVVQQRFKETSIFADGSVIEQSNALRAEQNFSPVSRLLYHRYVMYSQQILKQLALHFDPSYLFVAGDANPRHTSQLFGLFYPLDAILLLFGIYVLLTKYRRWGLFIFGWILIATLPAAISTGAPHALRTLISLPAWIIILSLGGYKLWQLLNHHLSHRGLKYVATALFFTMYMLQFLIFFQFLISQYPKLYSGVWQFGYKEMLHSIAQVRADNPGLTVYITREQGRPAMYYWFYNQVDPRLVQLENDTSPKDQGEFLRWQNVYFIDRAEQLSAPAYIVASSSEFIQGSSSLQSQNTISDYFGNIVWSIHKIDSEK